MGTKNSMNGTIQPAIDEVLQLLGIGGMGAVVETGILKGKRSVVPTLHRWTVALCLGEHFERGRHIVEDLGAAKMDDAKLRVILETLGGEIKCPTHDALNILAYTTLEYLQYPRLSQITLSNDQDARELFLAFVFLLGRQQWFHRVDRGCAEYLKFRKCLITSINDGIDVLNIEQGLEKLEPEHITAYIKRLERTIQCSPDLMTDNESTVTGNVVPLIPILSVKSSHSVKGVPLVNFIKVSDTNRPNSDSRKETGTRGAAETNQSAHTLTIPTKTPANLSTRTVGLLKPVPLGKKTIRVDPLARNDDNVANKGKSKVNINDVFSGVEAVVREVISDFQAKAQLLCRSKNAETFDSELLRIIIGQNDQQVLFNNLMDNSEITDSIPEVNVSSARTTKLSSGRTKVVENKNDMLDKDTTTSELHKLLDDIKHLSHTIIQGQSRLKRLAQDVEAGDAERLKCFSRLSENLKIYDRSMNNKDYDVSGDQNAFINDRYSMPSPAEWLLISQKESFEKHLALLEIIAKSLHNETNRASMFEVAIAMLDHVKPEQSNKRTSSTKAPTPAEGMKLITIPHEVRDTVNAIKSFMVDGIPSENFRSGEGTQVAQGATDFLRQINSSFANYRASTLTSEKGKKGSFLNYLTAALKERCTERKVNIDTYTDTREAIDKMLHLFEDSAKHDPRIEFTCLKKWIQGMDDANALNETNISSPAAAYSTQGPESLEQQEAHDFEVLQKLVNHESIVIDASQPPVVGIGPDLRRGNILDFKHYFNLARDEYINKQANDGEGSEPTFVKFGRLLKDHNSHITRSHVNDSKAAADLFERILQCVPSVTLIK